ncbi:MAG: hypothetical protein ACI82A_003529, partial [Candidatus Azotimanducaceae bacterium]
LNGIVMLGVAAILLLLVRPQLEDPQPEECR